MRLSTTQSLIAGLHLSSPTTLVVVLDSLTFHIISGILTAPILQPVDSLRATLSARDVFLDCARRRRRKFQSTTDRALTASTTGLEALDFTGDILTWMTEWVDESIFGISSYQTPRPPQSRQCDARESPD